MDLALEAALRGSGAEGLESVEVRVRPALSASAIDVLDADGFVLGTPANIGYMSGALKFFFDNIFYPTLTAKVGAPYGLYVHGNNDTTGALRSVESIASGMGWIRAAEPISIVGSPSKADLDAVADLSSTVAAHVVGLI
jgi:multimeric flavodoxin WrbA